MLNSNINYPHPLLRVTTEDFISSKFDGDLEILRETQGFKVIPRFSVNNEQINNLIRTGVFSYAVQIQCRSTYYRAVEYVKDNTPFFINGGTVHELVELCPCIIAMQDLKSYLIDDFVPAFKQVPVSVYKNDVVGIGNTIRFHAYYKADEVKKASSVITVQSDDSIKRMQVDFNKPNIIVTLPKTQYDTYINIGNNATSDVITLLTGVVSVPVIALALSEIDPDDENDYADLPWYKSLRASLDKLANGDPATIDKLLEDKLSTAQLLLGDNLSASLNILLSILNKEG
jgi:hypothetical protein